VGTSLVDSLGGLSTSEIVTLVGFILTTIAITVQTWFVFHLLRQHGRLLLRIDELEKRQNAGSMAAARTQPLPPGPLGLPIGSVAPSFKLRTLTGDSLTLDDLVDGRKPIALIFSDPNCGPCAALMPQIAKWQHEFAAEIRIAVVSSGSVKAHSKSGKKYSVADVLLQTDREVAQAYQANGTPAAVLIRADGYIGSQVVMGSEAIARLIAGVTGRVPVLASSKPNGEHAANRSNMPALRIGDAASSPGMSQ
jgi:peroxiredoxin